MSSCLENSMLSLIGIFHKYSGKEGSSESLTKSELKDLLKNELSFFLTTQKDPESVDKIMKDLDSNGDGTVDFQEFAVMVVALTIACNEAICKK